MNKGQSVCNVEEKISIKNFFSLGCLMYLMGKFFFTWMLFDSNRMVEEVMDEFDI